MISSTDEEYVVFGTLSRPHGVRGEMRLVPARPGDELPKGLKELDVRPKHGPPQKLTLRSLRTTNQAYLVMFTEVPDRNAAEAMAGAQVTVKRALLPKPKAGEMYLFELVGVQVQLSDGQVVGTVRAIQDNRGQDLMVIATPQGERLLPAVPAFLRHLNREAGVLTVSVPDGLWDDSEGPVDAPEDPETHT